MRQKEKRNLISRFVIFDKPCHTLPRHAKPRLALLCFFVGRAKDLKEYLAALKPH